jgi:hypothetical protein
MAVAFVLAQYPYVKFVRTGSAVLIHDMGGAQIAQAAPDGYFVPTTPFALAVAVGIGILVSWLTWTRHFRTLAIVLTVVVAVIFAWTRRVNEGKALGPASKTWEDLVEPPTFRMQRAASNYDVPSLVRLGSR